MFRSFEPRPRLTHPRPRLTHPRPRLTHPRPVTLDPRLTTPDLDNYLNSLRIYRFFGPKYARREKRRKIGHERRREAHKNGAGRERKARGAKIRLPLHEKAIRLICIDR